MIDKDFYTLEEAQAWLSSRGFSRSLVWLRTMVYKKKRPFETELRLGRRVIHKTELAKILKQKPKLNVVVTALAFFLLFSGNVFAGPQWEGIVVHHTDSTHMSLGECNEWHKARGWEGCGYNFIIEPSGRLIEARGFGKVGAHARGFNSRMLGIALVGTETFSVSQLRTLRQFVANVRGKYPIRRVFLHRDIGATECPGATLFKQVRAIWP